MKFRTLIGYRVSQVGNGSDINKIGEEIHLYAGNGGIVADGSHSSLDLKYEAIKNLIQNVANEPQSSDKSQMVINVDYNNDIWNKMDTNHEQLKYDQGIIAGTPQLQSFPNIASVPPMYNMPSQVTIPPPSITPSTANALTQAAMQMNLFPNVMKMAPSMSFVSSLLSSVKETPTVPMKSTIEAPLSPPSPSTEVLVSNEVETKMDVGPILFSSISILPDVNDQTGTAVSEEKLQASSVLSKEDSNIIPASIEKRIEELQPVIYSQVLHNFHCHLEKPN